jgi:hypothetical protein
MVWIEPSLGEPAAEAKLSQALGDSVLRGLELQRAAMDTLGERMAKGPPPVQTADVLKALADAGFVSLDPLGGPDMEASRWPQSGSRMLVVDGNEDKLLAETASVPLVRAIANAGAPVVLAEIFRAADGLEPRGGVVGPVRRDRGLAERVATVDDLEEPQGQAVLALALEYLGRGRAGHFGEGPGAARQLPDPAELPR